MRELEQAWQGTLFKRTGRGVELSALGEEALKRVRALLRNADQISEDMRSLGQLPAGRVTLALPPSLIGSVPPELIDRLSSKFPAIRLRIYEGFSDQIQRWLTDRFVDIGVYSQFCVESEPAPTLQPELLLAAKTQLVLAGFSDDSRLPAEIDFKQLADFPLVLPVPTNSLRVVVDLLARKMSLTLSVMAEAESASCAGGAGETLRLLHAEGRDDADQGPGLQPVLRRGQKSAHRAAHLAFFRQQQADQSGCA